MKRNILGRTGIEVTELCFGALPMGPLQKNVPIEECVQMVSAALQGGVNFIDTAQMYKTYEPIRRAIKISGKRPVIATKSAAAGYEQMQQAIDEALESLELDYIDIFHLHAARAGDDVLDARRGAFECLLENKSKGRIKAVGISCHSAIVTMLAAQVEEIDVVFPIINSKGVGILDGSVQDMLEAIQECVSNKKGVYLMKVLAGGSLIDDYHKCMEFARSIPGYSSIALGMVNMQEVEFNLKYFGEGFADTSVLPSIKGYSKEFKAVEFLCRGCEACVSTCPNSAISMKNEKALIDNGKCLQCGYCVGACPQFAIRIV